MSPIAIFVAFMLGSLLGVGACCVYDWIVRKRIERDRIEREEKLVRARNQLDELLRRPNVRVIYPREFQVVQNRKPLRLQRPDPENVA